MLMKEYLGILINILTLLFVTLLFVMLLPPPINDVEPTTFTVVFAVVKVSISPSTVSNSNTTCALV